LSAILGFPKSPDSDEITVKLKATIIVSSLLAATSAHADTDTVRHGFFRFPRFQRPQAGSPPAL
jgi:hypothetical protein